MNGTISSFLFELSMVVMVTDYYFLGVPFGIQKSTSDNDLLIEFNALMWYLCVKYTSFEVSCML